MTEVELANAERNATALIARIDRDANGPFGMAANTTDAQLRDMAQGILALVAEVQRITVLTMAVDLLQAENAALREEVAKMAPLWHIHQAPPDGVTYTRCTRASVVRISHDHTNA